MKRHTTESMQGTPVHGRAVAAVVLLSCLMMAGALAVQVRYLGAVAGIVPTQQPPAATAGSIENSEGSGTVNVSYASEAAILVGGDAAGDASTDLHLDDRWFAQNPCIYQHDLATSCAVLSVVCNAESQYYGGVPGAMPVAEQTLYDLGFHDVRTDSYRLRSNVLDELGALMSKDSDVAAYTLASKPISLDGGRQGTLVVVGVRGSYGAEWASNFNLLNLVDGHDDHRGFSNAADEVKQAVEQYVRELGKKPNDVRILITGHSRGGAVANLVAARLDDEAAAGAGIAPARNIYAYTFASPGSTRATDRSTPRYNNIYNVVNDSDIVPQVPFSTWGYGRYGATVSLPSAKEQGFVGQFERMCGAFRENTGVSFADSKSALIPFDLFSGPAGRGTGSISPREIAEVLAQNGPISFSGGFAATVRQLLSVDLETALASHLPDTYIAWMQSIDSDDLEVQ